MSNITENTNKAFEIICATKALLFFSDPSPDVKPRDLCLERYRGGEGKQIRKKLRSSQMWEVGRISQTELF